MTRSLLIWAVLAAASAGAGSAPVAEPRLGDLYAQTVREGTTILSAGAGAKVRALTPNENILANGQTVNAPNGLALLFVLSNGDALYLPTGGRLTLDEFTQDPFFDTGRDRAYEPSRSTVRLTLAQGTLAVSGRQPVPTSAFVLTTPLAKFSFHSQSFVVRVEGDSVALSLFDGTVEVTMPETGFHDTLLEGQTATITRQNLHAPYPLQLATITTAEHDHYDGWLATANLISIRYTFSNEGKNLVATQLLPQSFTQQISVDDPRFR
jgi:hypothetical protein